MSKPLAFGLFSFGDYTPELFGDNRVTPAQRFTNLVEEIVLADQVGLEFFGLGEHHRPDFLVSAPTVVLAAAASLTKRIRLGTAVTVLSSEDPVRVYQQFATLDLLSGGRAEIMAGRGSFTESFPLFGYDLDDYEELFLEKLDLLLALCKQGEHVTWAGSGKFRAPLTGQSIQPRPIQEPLPVTIAVGGSPESAARAGVLGLPLAIAIFGGQPARFKAFVDYYRESGSHAGHSPETLKVTINQHGFLADTSQVASELVWPSYKLMVAKLGRERGWPPQDRSHFEAGRGPRGHLVVGSPQEAIDKILSEWELFHMDRFALQFTVGGGHHREALHSIELFGNVVAPAVRKATAG
jgi:probable LLM family oxidoreductase